MAAIETALTGGYGLDDLRAAFAQVEAKTHWKDPIDTLLAEGQVARLMLIAEAVEFYTATPATFTVERQPDGRKMVRVQAAGYRAGPAGDH